MKIIKKKILLSITIGCTIFFLACSKDSPVAPENDLGKFSLESFDADAKLLYRPVQEDTAIKVTFSIFYQFENQPGTIASLAMSFSDGSVAGANFSYAKPQLADKLLEFPFQTWIPSDMMSGDSLLFDLNIQGVFWSYDFQSDTFQGFENTFNWSKDVHLKVQR